MEAMAWAGSMAPRLAVASRAGSPGGQSQAWSELSIAFASVVTLWRLKMAAPGSTRGNASSESELTKTSPTP